MNMMRMIWVVAVALLTSVSAAAAQSWPTKPVKVLNGFPPGGGVDVVARVVTEHLSKVLGQPFVIESKPGAAGNIAGEALMQAPADGYTIYIVAPAVTVVNHAMYKDMPFDPAKDFAPISLVARLPFLIEVSTKHPFTTFNDFIAFAKTTSQPLNHGSPGIGSAPHLAAELLKMRLGFKSEHVPYRGTAPFNQGMMQKELDWSFDVPTSALSLSQGGFARLVAITAEKPEPKFPGVPTLESLGVPDAVWVSWFALVAKTGTPKPIVERISQEVAKAYQNPELAGRLVAVGLEPVATTPEQTAKIFDADRARWSAVVRANNIKVE
jgi:tripartite-type tricarboxylate transporter receptor subunit TctC